MRQTFNILVLLLLCLPTFISAQNNSLNEPCGTDFTPEMEARLLQNIALAKALNLPSANRTTTYVPIKFHLVAESNGTGRVKKSKIYTALCALNQRYADQDVVFYLAGMYDLNNSILYNHTSASAAQFQMSLRKNQHFNAVNIFVCNAVTLGSSSGGLTLGYYSPTYDIIAIRADQMNNSSTTLTHELGHFFSLPHPFNGWEGQEYHTNNNPSGAPYGVGNLPPASMGGELVELVNGSNCNNSGDYFCDTEPDYNLGFLGGNNCTYSSGAVDPNGQAINPDETLYMSYFNDNCTNKFSNDQKGAIAADMQQGSRNFLFINSPSTTTEVTAAANLAAPANNSTTPFWDEVYLNWDNVSGANQYLVQISRSQTFPDNLIVEEEIVSNSLFLAQNLNAGTTYYWRIKAYNEVSPCNGYSAVRKFTTSSFTVNTKQALTTASIQLQPNFTNEGQTVNLNIQADKKIEATIRIVNINGQIMQNSANVTFQAGTHVHAIKTQGLAPGVYIVNFQTAQGQINERLIITN
jgi:hypothetical protein